MTNLELENANILVIGDVILDRYWSGAVDRISPESPVPVVNVKTEEHRPGGAANVAKNIRALNANVTLVGLIGQDNHADSLISALAQAELTNDLNTFSSVETITKLRVLGRGQQLIRLDFESQIPAEAAAETLDYAISRLSGKQAVIISDYNKGTIADPQMLIQAARKLDIPITIDPKPYKMRSYHGATLLTPNFDEFITVVGPCTSEQDIEEKSHRLIKDLNLDGLLITRSEKGISLFRRNSPPFHQAAHAREVFDVTGAGDTVIAVLTTAIACGASFETAATLANKAAGIVVNKIGTATVTKDELFSSGTASARIASLPLAASEMIEAKRNLGQKIVMTNGCFDILHAGHVSYLQAAKGMGDFLVVALNDDASVTRLKGMNRPVNSLANRANVLAGLQSVDLVVPFGEDTPATLIDFLKPDVLVKGNDYEVNEIAGAELVLARGGRVETVELVDGLSTTNILAAVAKGKQGADDD